MDETVWAEQLSFASRQVNEEDSSWKSRFINEIEKESERGQVLTIVSFIDELLIRILKSFSPNKAHANKLLTELDSCLGTIMNRANVAFMLSLINEVELKSIKHLAKIRNEFAHKWDDTSFNNKEVEKIVRSFPRELFIGITGSNKARFMRVSSYVIQELIAREHYCKRLSPVIPSTYRDLTDASPEERRRYFDMEKRLGVVKSSNIESMYIFCDPIGEFIHLKIRVKDPNEIFIIHS